MDVGLFSKLTSIGGTATGTRTPVFAVRGRRLNRLTMAAWLAAEPGFEPGLNESESFVLPLHNSAIVVRTHRARPTDDIILPSGVKVKRFFSIYLHFTFMGGFRQTGTIKYSLTGAIRLKLSP